MTESDLKRALLRSLRAQGGAGFRMEDKYAIGRPDCYMWAPEMPPFLVEAKMLRDRASLFCTAGQQVAIDELNKPPWVHAVLVGYSEKLRALFIGPPGAKLRQCRYVPAPSRLDSPDWWVVELLGKWHHDIMRGIDLVK